ncbi:MAG TPA: glycoside hydrolase family 16 protein [Candidatus Xenobia bacterium]|nr:glycoside hydrolase family 16 protein [Candidatus Xenobia bacterium]
MKPRQRLGVHPALLLLLVIGLVTTLVPGAPAAPKPNRGSGWEDDFTGGQLDRKRWTVSSWWAPGYIANDHIGYYEPENVSLQGGYLVMRLWQEPGLVDENPNGVISHGAHVTTKQKYGYGTYEWRMRMSSTAATPTGVGEPVSGSVSAGFIYVNNSQTEIDFEFGGHLPETLYMVNWYNTDPSTGPFESQEEYTAEPIPGLNSQFMTFKFVWEPGKISYYVNRELKAVHTTNVPTAPAYFMINHWGTNNPYWGGPATFNTDRYFYIDWVRYTPLP